MRKYIQRFVFGEVIARMSEKSSCFFVIVSVRVLMNRGSSRIDSGRTVGPHHRLGIECLPGRNSLSSRAICLSQRDTP